MSNHNARLQRLERKADAQQANTDAQGLTPWAAFADESALQTALTGGLRVAKVYLEVSPDDWDQNPGNGEE